MSNPSLIWAQLSLPNPPAWAIPFVSSDNASIITDVLNFQYYQLNLHLFVTNGIGQKINDQTAVPGNAIINQGAGRVQLAPGGSTVTITNSLALLGDIVIPVLETIDATLTRVVAKVTSNGVITITGNAAATGAVNVSFVLIKGEA